jgi:hemerythrin-like metal-binding protein
MMMAHASWDPALATGNELVDAEHIEIILMINELRDAISQARPREVQDDMLDRLMDHASSHFVHEEALMRSIYYPQLMEQKRLHKQFEAEAKRLSDEYRSGRKRLPITLAIFLQDWILKHIRNEDRKIGEFIRAQAEQAD